MSDPRDQLVTALAATRLFGGLERDALASIAPQVRLLSLSRGERLFRKGDDGGTLYLVLDGRLRVALDRNDGADLTVAAVGRGETVGEIQAITGGRRTASVYADVDSELIEIARETLERLAESEPDLLEGIAEVGLMRTRANQLAVMFPELYGKLDHHAFAAVSAELEWLDLAPGTTLFRQGDAGDSLYVVVSGRLRATVGVGDRPEAVIGEAARGETIGEMAILTGDPRSATVRATRDTQVVRLTKEGFDRVLERYPQAMMEVARTITRRARQSLLVQPTAARGTTAAVLPAAPEVKWGWCAERLRSALEPWGSVLCLGSAEVDDRLGAPGIAQATREDRIRDLRLELWLEEQEAANAFVLYRGDPVDSAWNRRCVRQVDHVVIVGEAGKPPPPGAIETGWLAESQGTVGAARRTLVLLHPDGDRHPSGTAAWLERYDVERHHHVRSDTVGDFERVARFLAGRANGLVLGGGGARGFAHIGVIRALHEAGIPIDIVGGASMGALIGGEYAFGWSPQTMVDHNGELAHTLDYTFPFVSLCAAHSMVEKMTDYFGDVRIEDFWLPYFCVSSNLTRAEVTVHQHGSFRHGVRASSSIPGLLPPVTHGGDLLVDGGVLDNLPVDVMREQVGTGTVIAVDVGAEVDLEGNEDYGDELSGWRILWGRLSPLARTPKVPNIAAVLTRTAELSSVRAQRQLRDRGIIDLYLRPPVEKYEVLAFEKIPEIAEAGYAYARAEAQSWLATRAAGATRAARL